LHLQRRLARCLVYEMQSKYGNLGSAMPRLIEKVIFLIQLPRAGREMPFAYEISFPNQLRL
jgi:hypothetical protein